MSLALRCMATKQSATPICNFSRRTRRGNFKEIDNNLRLSNVPKIMKDFENQQTGLQIDTTEMLRCKVRDEDFNTCGSCHSCVFTSKLSDSTQWLSRAGDSSKLRFLTGILVRCQSVNILENVQNVLQVTFGKDFTYSRSKQKPSLPEDMGTWSSDRALDTKILGVEMLETWDWFSRSQPWIKCNYLMGILSLCDTELLHMLGNLTSVLLVREKRAFLQFNALDDEFEDDATSIPDSSYSFNSLDNPDLELLVRASSFYDQIDSDFTTALETCHLSELCTTVTYGSLGLGSTIVEKQQFEDSDTDSEDPALMVVPRSSKSLSGVSRHRDFIRRLPVHLAKKILGLLDRTSMRSCRDVSQHWRYLTEETLDDLNSIKTVQKQAMMMQSNTHTGASATYAKIREVLVPIRDEEKHMHHVDCFSRVRKERVFEAVYAGVRTRALEMEERNVYCGVYNVTMLLDREDQLRVVDYCGGQMVAMGSKDRLVRLLDVVTHKELSPVIQGHAGSIRAVLLCEDRGLVISASYDLSIRCWNLMSGACIMLFRGHLGTINCLDMHDNMLVSGAKDCMVKVWNLQTGQCYEKLRFKHHNPIQCVKVDQALVLSSCDKGLVKIWSIESASLVKIIDAHRSSVTSLFFDHWHILSGGSDGQVMAWSTHCDMKKCLMTYQHPKEVQTLALMYLRVISGCADGKIRIFNFLTGDCLRVIKAGAKQSPVISIHPYKNNIVVNTHSAVTLYQFAEVQWDFSVIPGRDPLLAGRKPVKGVLRNVPYPFVRAERMAQVGSANRKIYDREGEKMEKPALSHHARSLSAPSMRRAQAAQQESMRAATWSELRGHRRSRAFIDLQPEFITQPPSALTSGRPVSGHSAGSQSRVGQTPRSATTSSARDYFGTTKGALTRSEKAVRERVKVRGPHRPVTPEHVLLRVNSARVSQRSDQAGANMVLNARVRDAWGPPPPPSPPPPPPPQKKEPEPPKQRPPPSPPQLFYGVTKTYVPLLSTPLELKMRHSLHRQDLSSSLPSPTVVRPQTGHGFGERPPPPTPRQKRPQTSCSQGTGVRKVGAFTTTAAEDVQAPQRMFMRRTCDRPGRHVDFEMPNRMPATHNPLDPFRERGGFRLQTDTQLEEYMRAQGEGPRPGPSAERREKQKKRIWRMKVKGFPISDYTKEDQVFAPELGPDVYI